MTRVFCVNVSRVRLLDSPERMREIEEGERERRRKLRERNEIVRESERRRAERNAAAAT
jgi:hypothetical protein